MTCKNLNVFDLLFHFGLFCWLWDCFCLLLAFIWLNHDIDAMIRTTIDTISTNNVGIDKEKLLSSWNKFDSKFISIELQWSFLITNGWAGVTKMGKWASLALPGTVTLFHQHLLIVMLTTKRNNSFTNRFQSLSTLVLWPTTPKANIDQITVGSTTLTLILLNHNDWRCT